MFKAVINDKFVTNIENSEGFTDNEGKYLCDYFILFFETTEKQINIF